MDNYTPSSSYPNLIRMSDPLLVRLSETSLLVGNVNFYVKCKRGYYFTGIQVYVSGINTPVLEKQATVTSGTMPNGTIANYEQSISDAELNRLAKTWLDDLETQIATSLNDNSVQTAIDTLRWQLHYDITKSTEGIPQTITIDTNVNAITLKDGTDKISGNVVDLSNRISPSNSTLYQSIYAVAQSLKGDSDTYTISRALRESGEYSVSGATKEQTDLIDTEFTEVENTLGTNTDTSLSGTMFGSLNGIDSQIGHDASETVVQKLDALDSNNTEILTSVNGISNKIGNDQDSSTGTLWYDVLHRSGTRSMPSGAQYQSDSPLGQIRSNTNDLHSALTGNNGSIYNALLGTNGALQNAVGYDYSTSNSGGLFITDSGGTPVASNKYYIRTESSRFALVYNIVGGVKANNATYKSQPAANPNPW